MRFGRKRPKTCKQVRRVQTVTERSSQQPISCVYGTTSSRSDEHKHTTVFFLSAFGISPLNDQSALRKDPIGPTELPSHWSVQWTDGSRSEAITERQEVKLVDQLIAATKHFCQTSGLRDTERFCLLFILDFQSSSVQLSPVVLRLIGSVFVQLITLQLYLL